MRDLFTVINLLLSCTTRYCFTISVCQTVSRFSIVCKR